MNHRQTAMRSTFGDIAKRAVIISVAVATGVIGSEANAGFMRPPIVLPLPIPGPKPPAPQVVPPPSGVQMANNSVPQSVTLRWYQPLMVATQAPVEAGAFVICLQAPAQACIWAASNPASGVWNDAATGPSFTRIPRYSTSSPFIANPPPPILQGYSYTATLSIANTLFDRDLKWTVGACAGPFTTACTFVSPGSVWYSTKDLVAVSATIDGAPTSTGGAITASFSFNNVGTAAGNFSAKYQVIEVLNAGGRCERDPALADPSFASVVLDNGAFVFPNAIPPGRAVNAIVKPAGDASPVLVFSPLSLGAQAMSFVAGLPRDQFAAAHTFAWRNAAEMQRVYVLAATVDNGGAITEFNESNNGLASCDTITR